MENKFLYVAGKSCEIISALVLSVGLVFAYLGYQAERSADQRRFTFEFSQQYYVGELQAARLSLRNEVREIANVRSELSNDEIAIAIAARTKSGNSKLTEQQVLAVSDYFNGAERCVQAQLCASEIFQRLHAEEASYIRCFLEPTLKAISLEGGFAATIRGLEKFSSDPSSC
ncbi:MAG: hypothetical protein AAFR71_09860 [Pseudomonadota bacterium]